MAKKTTKKPQEPETTVSLTVNNQVFSASGATIEDALLKIHIPQPKLQSVLTVTKDGATTKPLSLSIPNVLRLFYPGLSGKVQRIALAKRLAFYA